MPSEPQTSGLRTVGPADLPEVVSIFLDCWMLSYRAAMPASLVERMTPAYAESLWREGLADARTDHVGAEDGDGRLVGFVGFRLLDDGTGYVSSLYVSPTAQGGGHGRRLLTASERALAEQGAVSARLWVFEQNAPSRAFYERAGWLPDGRRETLPEWGVPQLGLTKALASAAGAAGAPAPLDGRQ